MKVQDAPNMEPTTRSNLYYIMRRTGYNEDADLECSTEGSNKEKLLQNAPIEDYKPPKAEYSMKTNARIDLGHVKCQTPNLNGATPCWNTE